MSASSYPEYCSIDTIHLKYGSLPSLSHASLPLAKCRKSLKRDGCKDYALLFSKDLNNMSLVFEKTTLILLRPYEVYLTISTS